MNILIDNIPLTQQKNINYRHGRNTCSVRRPLAVTLYEAQTKYPRNFALNAIFEPTVRQLAYVYEIIEYSPEQKLVMRTAEGPFPMETTYIWETWDNGKTRMTLRNAGQPSGFSKLFAPLMAIMMRKANAKDLKNIKRIIESK